MRSSDLAMVGDMTLHWLVIIVMLLLQALTTVAVLAYNKRHFERLRR